MKLVILLACLLQLGATCSCYMGGDPYERDPRESIIEVRIEKVLQTKPAKKSLRPSRIWENPGALYTQKVSVVAVVTKVLRDAGRNYSIDEKVSVKSSMSDAMCGVGGWLTPGRVIVFGTYNKKIKKLMLCEFMDFNYERMSSGE